MMMSGQSKVFHSIMRLIRFKRMWAGLAAAAQSEDPVAFAAAVARLRRRQDQRTPPRSVARHAELTTRTVEGFALYHLAARGGSGSGVVLYLHGGAYVIGPSAQHWSTLLTLQHATGLDVAVLDYPKAPEHTCLTTIRVTLAAYRALLDDYAPAQITVMGDSAGGGLALVLAQQLKQAGLPQPGRLVLMSPWLDVSMSHPQARDYEPLDVILSCDGLRACAQAYAGGLPLTDPRLSPVRGDLEGLPPTTVFVGDHEVFFPDIRDFCARERTAGRRVELVVGHGMPHAWFLFPLPEYQRTVKQLADLLVLDCVR